MVHILLAGGGHVQLAVLRALAGRPIAGARVALLSDADRLFYSGMLPGWMAGAYRLDALVIPLAPIASAAGARLHVAAVAGLDAEALTAETADGARHRWDLLSLATGSAIATAPFTALGDRLLPLRPIHRFVARWPSVLDAAGTRPGFRLDIAGGGAGGVELALAAAVALGRLRHRAELRLFVGTGGLLAGHPPGLAVRVRQWLRAAGVALVEAPATDGEDRDLLIAATGAAPPPFLRDSGLVLAADGFVAVSACYQSLSHAQVLAAGDIAARADAEAGRSGLHAVRAGPVVARNLRALAEGRPLVPHRTGKPELYLLATRPGHAIATGWLRPRAGRWGWTAEGRWLWWLKDRIDRRYIDRHRLTGQLWREQAPGGETPAP